MVMVRIIAVLVLVAFVLALVFLVTRNRRYLTWAWRVLLAALFCSLGVMTFYFVERVFFGG
jgi:hypothetical protein